MTDHQRFESLLNKAGISRKDLANELGMTYDSVTNQLAPSKPLPKWAKSVLFVCDRVEGLKAHEGANVVRISNTLGSIDVQTFSNEDLIKLKGLLDSI